MVSSHNLAALFGSLLLTACATAPAPAPDLAAPPPPDAAIETAFDAGVVSAADPRAAEAGAAMLRQGGSATDAAIATMLALTVVEPQSSGIGGGGFYLRGTPDGAIESIDGRETAPKGATPDWFLDDKGKTLPYREAVLSGLSIGVPGNIALAAEAHAKHGTLPWADLFWPAISIARDGWTVTERFHSFLARRADSAARDPAAKALFYDADGNPVPVGTHISNPELADTLEAIAEGGRAAFYDGAAAGALATKIAADTPRERPMTAADISSYRAKWREPVCRKYRAYRICGMGPPSSGATTVLAILGQLERFDMTALGKDSPVAWHLFAESQRLAYADRERFLADPDFIAVPVVELLEPQYLAKRSALISADSTLEKAEPGLDMPPPDGMEPPENGTSHFSVIDRHGTAISYTSTIESAFGSGLMFGGYYLNNELTDFSRVPQVDGQLVANRPQGGKRPRSSMAPTLVYGPDGTLVLSVGAAGGATIPVQVTRVLIGFIDWHLPISEAVALPVLFSPGDTVFVEEGSTLEAMIPALEALGHKGVTPRGLPLKTNAVAVVGGKLDGAADPRSEGAAVSE
jgi:gamma-glutamyltranspeptidase/glutathione hydrolase